MLDIVLRIVGWCLVALVLTYSIRREIKQQIEGAFKYALGSVLFARSVRTDLDETILTIVKSWKPTHPWVTIRDTEIITRLQKLGEYAVILEQQLREKLEDPDNITHAEVQAIDEMWKSKRASGVVSVEDLVRPPADMPSLKRPNIPREWSDLPGPEVKRYSPTPAEKSVADRLGIRTFEPEPVRTSRCINCGKEDYEHVYVSDQDPILCPEQSPMPLSDNTKQTIELKEQTDGEREV